MRDRRNRDREGWRSSEVRDEQSAGVPVPSVSRGGARKAARDSIGESGRRRLATAHSLLRPVTAAHSTGPVGLGRAPAPSPRLLPRLWLQSPDRRAPGGASRVRDLQVRTFGPDREELGVGPHGVRGGSVWRRCGSARPGQVKRSAKDTGTGSRTSSGGVPGGPRAPERGHAWPRS